MKKNDEIIWLTQTTFTNKKYIITSTKLRDAYFLYEVVDDKPVKTKYKASEPTTLYEYIKD